VTKRRRRTASGRGEANSITDPAVKRPGKGTGTERGGDNFSMRETLACALGGKKETRNELRNLSSKKGGRDPGEKPNCCARRETHGVESNPSQEAKISFQWESKNYGEGRGKEKRELYERA